MGESNKASWQIARIMPVTKQESRHDNARTPASNKVRKYAGKKQESRHITKQESKTGEYKQIGNREHYQRNGNNARKNTDENKLKKCNNAYN